MKRYLMCLLAGTLALTMLLSSCGGETEDSTEPGESAEQQTDETTSGNGGIGGLFSSDFDSGSASDATEESEEPMEVAGGLFFRPSDGGTGDVIPIYEDGQYYLFFLHSVRKKWCYVTTTDFVNYSEIKALRNFGGTGDALLVDGTWHLFAAQSLNGEEHIHHFTGDAIDNLKDTFQNIDPDQEVFYEYAWRDPEIWYADDLGKWCMVCCCDARDGDSVRRNAAVAFLTSDDLYNWTEQKSLFSAGYLSGSCECPDYFKIGDWYYLVYSSCSYGKTTHYVKSREPYGPWEIPDNDTFDSLFFYAGKTVSDGTDRYVIAWAGDRSNNIMALDASGSDLNKDFATIKYAGSMIIHKIVQKPNGDLTVAPVDAIVNSVSKEVKNSFTPLSGDWKVDGNTVSVTSEDSFAALLLQNMPERFVLKCRMQCDARQAGIAVNTNSTFAGKGYYFMFDRVYSRLRMQSGVLSDLAGYYFPYDCELERPIDLDPSRTYDLTLIVDGEIAVLYVDGEGALTIRMTAEDRQAMGLFCYNGSAVFSDIVMMK